MVGHTGVVDAAVKAVEAVDRCLGRVYEMVMANHGHMLITADHGNDPSYPGTDHTREYIPLLAYSKSFKGSGVLPVGHYADISATVAENFEVDATENGQSFLGELN